MCRNCVRNCSNAITVHSLFKLFVFQVVYHPLCVDFISQHINFLKFVMYCIVRVCVCVLMFISNYNIMYVYLYNLIVIMYLYC